MAMFKDLLPMKPNTDTRIYYTWIDAASGDPQAIYAHRMAVLPCGALEFRIQKSVPPFCDDDQVCVIASGQWRVLRYDTLHAPFE